jgi:hypothetical protein
MKIGDTIIYLDYEIGHNSEFVDKILSFSHDKVFVNLGSGHYNKIDINNPYINVNKQDIFCVQDLDTWTIV